MNKKGTSEQKGHHRGHLHWADWTWQHQWRRVFSSWFYTAGLTLNTISSFNPTSSIFCSWTITTTSAALAGGEGAPVGNKDGFIASAAGMESLPTINLMSCEQHTVLTATEQKRWLRPNGTKLTATHFTLWPLASVLFFTASLFAVIINVKLYERRAEKNSFDAFGIRRLKLLSNVSDYRNTRDS